MNETGCSGLVHWDDPVGWGRREVGGVSGWETHVHPWLIHVNVWQNPLQYCKVASLQLIKIIGKKIQKTKRVSCKIAIFLDVEKRVQGE